MLPKTFDLASGILKQSRMSLARGITLLESSTAPDKLQACLLIDYLSTKFKDNQYGNSAPTSYRIGVTGPPGAGKSTFIEKLGMKFIEDKNKVAVIPVDPSSTFSGGSILGDKTRMEMLSRLDEAYIRASPSRCLLGGIAAHTDDVLYTCMVAGFNIGIVESVGLGQSEVEIDQAVDLLILLVPPAGGDDLQAAKKGVVEVADLIVVNKADGDLLASAQHTKADYAGALQFVRRKASDWEPSVMLMSAKTGRGIDEVYEKIKKYREVMASNGSMSRKRKAQSKHWMWSYFCRELMESIESNQSIRREAQALEKDLFRGRISSRTAARRLFEKFKGLENNF